MTTMERKSSIMFIAGDPSGDAHASFAVREIKARNANARVWGIGGAAMTNAGFEAIMPFEKFNRMGYAEVISQLPFFLRAKKEIIKLLASEERPDVLVCVDYSGFNMPILKAARKLNIPVVWYIAPMVWAWKRKRAKTLGNLASHIATIFPFENEYFSQYAAPVTFVGNPLVEALQNINSSAKKNISNGIFNLALIPGSRPQEIKKNLCVMIDAALMLRKKYPQIKITVSQFGNSNKDLFESAKQKGINIFKGELKTLLQESDLALVTSGTATLETALLGVPMAIVYRTSRVTYNIYKKFVKINHIGLPNIIAQKTIVPEFIQDGATAQNLCDALCEFASNQKLYDETVKSLQTLKETLGEKKPSLEVADIVYSYIK